MESSNVLKTLSMGKGMEVRLIENSDLPENSTDRYVTHFTCTGEEILNVQPHWHKRHEEQFIVLEGRVKATLDGKISIVKAGDPPLIVARRVVHSFQSFPGEKVVGEERVIPGGKFKFFFFNDLFGNEVSPGFWRSMKIMYDGDGYVPLPFNSRFLDELFMKVFGGLANLFMAPQSKEL